MIPFATKKKNKKTTCRRFEVPSIQAITTSRESSVSNNQGQIRYIPFSRHDTKDNHLVNLQQLTKCAKSCLVCSSCSSNKITIQERDSVGISSVIEVSCSNCNQETYYEPKTTNFRNPQGPYKILDFNTNVLSFLTPLLLGCGAKEVSIVLASLGFQYSKSFEHSYYYYIDRICESVREVHDELVEDALEEEIAVTYRKMLEK